MITTILLFVVVLSVLVFVHELGHFLMAKKMGMRVEEFGFGFPPRLFAIRKGETDYSINWIPLGGFVKIKGESGENKGDSDSFASKKAWQRFVVLIAGVVMNLVLAFVLLSAGFMLGLPSVVDETTPANATIEDSKLSIMSVLEGSPAFDSGVQSGTSIASIDGRVFDDALDARTYIKEHASDGITMTVKAGEDFVAYDLVSEQLVGTEIVGVGIGFVQTALVSYPFFESISRGFLATGHFTVEVTKAFVDLIKNLIFSQRVGVELSGPVGIAVLTGEVAALGFVYLLQFAALLSINLAVINILPFPALDGGRILFLIIELFRGGKPVNERIETSVHNIGFAMLMILVLFVTYQDFVTFGDRIFGAIKSVIGV